MSSDTGSAAEKRPDAGLSPVLFPSLRAASQEQWVAQAKARGHAAGYAAGLRAANAEVEQVTVDLQAEHAAVLADERARVEAAISILDASARALNERALPVIADVQDSLVAAALDLAEAILGYELSSVENSARSALARATGFIDPKIAHTVRMSPDDLAALDDKTRTGTSVQFVADPSMPRGDAITEFPDGYLDARIDTALARAKDALRGGVQ